MLGRQAQMPLMDPGLRCRLFGMLPARCNLSPFEQDSVIATFGPAVHRVPRRGSQYRPVSVAWMRVDAPRVPSRMRNTDLQQDGYWHHHARNRRIAHLINALANGDRSTIASLAPGAELHIAAHPMQRILVAVDALEHAIALAELIPDYSIMAGLDPLLDKFSARQCDVYRERALHWTCMTTALPPPAASTVVM